MRTIRWFLVVVELGLSVLPIPANAQFQWQLSDLQLPANRVAYFRFREFPADPLSPVTLVVTAHLSAAERVYNKVAWRIDSLEFSRPGTTETWTKILPQVSTIDGLWWIKHASADTPHASEFVIPPWLTGQAVADSPGYANLNYDLVGHDNLEIGPFAITSRLTYHFAVATGPEPPDDGDDEPVESGGTPDPI